jgi:TIGR02099 family protein
MPSTAPASTRVRRLLRFAATTAILVAGAFFALLLAIRLVAYPEVETHRSDIARWLGQRIGQPVEIDGIVTGWDGWNPKLSIRGLRVGARERASTTLFELPRVDLVIAWTSLPILDLRLKELLIVAPKLSVRRDTAGRLHVAGLEVASEDNLDDSAFADWLLRQPQVVVADALVAWTDELRHAPQLLLDHVQFRLEQRLGHHQAGLTGVPPAELAAPIDLRADVTGESLKDLQSLRGRLYLRLDYADVAAWREWLPLPFAIENGKGALRLWVDFAHSQATDVVADLELADVRATFGEHLAPLTLAHVAGRAAWKRSDARTDFVATQLALALEDGVQLPPSDVHFTQLDSAPGTHGGGSFAITRVDLRPLATIASHLPLSPVLRNQIARVEPRGSAQNVRLEWSGDAEAPDRYLVKGDFQQVAISATDIEPGATNLSGAIEATERGGEVRIVSENATLTVPRLFADPVVFTTVQGSVGWTKDDSATQVRWKDFAFVNADVAGSTEGVWRSKAEGPGEIDAKGRLNRANLANASHYLPASLPAGARNWLRRALSKGSSSDARLSIRGDLARFPFPDRKEGEFQLTVKARDVTLDYADGWPPITDIAGELQIDGRAVRVDATGGRVDDAIIGDTRADIADVRDPDVVLRIEGTASGPTAQFLAFVTHSPIAEWSGHLADDATVTGDGRLALKFELPLHRPSQTTVAGEYRVAGNAVQLAGLPPLSDVSGGLLFSEHDVHTAELAAQVFGGPIELDVTSAAGSVHVSGNGTTDMQRLRSQYHLPLLDKVTGRTDWQLTLDARDRRVGWTVASSLVGAAVDLPAPIGKPAGDAVRLRVERQEATPLDDRISIDYGDIAKVALHRRMDAGTPVIDRVLVLVGKSAREPADADQPGVWIRADVAALNADEWLAVDLPSAGGAPNGTPASALSVEGVDLQAASLQVLGRKFIRLKTIARRQNGEWNLALDGSELAGTATWKPAAATQPNGRITARLTRLTPPVADAEPADANVAPSQVGHWPAVDLVADTFFKKQRALGRLELLAQPSGTDWEIQRLTLANEAGRIDAHGTWQNVAARSRTRLDVAVDVKEAGAFLGRFGWPDAVKGAPTKIEGQLSWAGGPGEFDYPSLTGKFVLRAGAGQFTKLDPGVGRLLGVLSLQALPRRISLDFRDVFSEGFAFDSVNGEVRVDSGVMHTDALRLAGPSAAVNIAGDVDLAQETQQLSVRVQPSLSSGVSAGAAALFIANPLLGAAVGAGTLLAQKMLNNPFDQLFSYRYAVSGSWDDPVVTRVGARAAGLPSTEANR